MKGDHIYPLVHIDCAESAWLGVFRGALQLLIIPVTKVAGIIILKKRNTHSCHWINKCNKSASFLTWNIIVAVTATVVWAFLFYLICTILVFVSFFQPHFHTGKGGAEGSLFYLRGTILVMALLQSTEAQPASLNILNIICSFS